MGCPQINHDPAHQQGQNIQRQPANARPVRNKVMERAAFDEEQIDGVARGARADVETQEHTESAIDRRVACQYLPLLEPNAIDRRDCDQRQQKPGFSSVFAMIHFRASL